MKHCLRLALLVATCLTMSNCVSAWMTASTGVTLKTGMERAEVHRQLGAPNATITDVTVLDTYGRELKAKFMDTHVYQGKLNSFDEGSGQAISNAVTLGTAEAIMIPMTAAEIAMRSMQHHRIEIAYDANQRLLEYADNEPLQRARAPDKSRNSAC
ncbi:hypothetical protein [Prosthecobacter dejongeii]|uniref:Uncharacterized protein n=1 Tax=Prosthecobacter dejongeii TaxID=48465 RepID=A0A7W8DNM5_9BACT|nr:hypothetical protein [Prosthecobacter dejongeii]MBB5036081.1 hypothetical protein [Prosthecobacter dejongeii]